MTAGDGPSPPAVKRIVVSVDDDHLAGLGRVADALRERGIVVDDVLDCLGVITGSAADDAQVRLAATVEGVSSVDEEVRHQLPPPDSPLQ